MPCTLHQRGLVGAQKAVRVSLIKGLLQEPVAKALRGLRQHHKLARNGRGHQRAVGGPLHLLDGIDGGQPDDGRAKLLHRVDGAVDGGRVNQRTNRVVYQNNIVRLGVQGGQCVRHRLLAAVSTLNHAHRIAKTKLGNLGLNTLNLRLAHRYADGRHPFHRGEGSQAVNQDRHTIEGEKLLGLRAGHPGSQPRRGKNHIYVHNSQSIQRLRPACSRQGWKPAIPARFPLCARAHHRFCALSFWDAHFAVARSSTRYFAAPAGPAAGGGALGRRRLRSPGAGIG